MIQPETLVKITDNAGGTVGKVFKILGSAHKRYATLGELVIVSVKVASPRKGVKKKDVHQAVVVRTRNAYRRKDGSYIRFDDNAVVLLEKGKNDPLAGRIFGPIPRELAEKGFQKIVSLAPEVL
ncbi:50S ribosomal protein L14 [Candidatus Nomurabacteria bacterium RIFCSPLOWO2_01_FULL_39_17]|uniref:Large ribosomal subunit protein uL14 n=1 Tax=Candidatus Nomurabacteria bacterium RIFCSPLOWO2_01_FULL_39_17 TaxID=1801770 RepID=A0A1F6WX83_9BACT|nr:MAG: 50S ribosomal protein L14 [Candidatus Nomurabacteria bacterium RIFCSPLOWO2_01_FULL_39_17]